jgi:cytochrome c oxidase subunit 3
MHAGTDTAVLEAHWGGGAAPFGASWQKTMMWIFIVTDALLFSGLLCGYAFLRQANASPWPDRTEVFSIPFIALMTFILITSSATMGSAVTAARLGDMKKALMYVSMTIVGGAAFLSCQAYEWTHLIHEGLTIQGNPFGISSLFGATFYILTGFHGCHVLSGVIYLLCIFIKGARGGYTAEHNSPVEIAGLYWHFVDLIWILVFTFVYLIA